MPCSQYDQLVAFVTNNMNKPELWETYLATAGSSDYSLETENLWYYLHPQNDHPDFTTMDTQMCHGSGKVCAVDAKHRMSSEWDALYVQRANVLRWVKYMYTNIMQQWFPPHGDTVYVTRDQLSTFDAHIRELQTFMLPRKSNDVHSSLIRDDQQIVYDAFQKLRQCDGSTISEPKCMKVNDKKRKFDFANQTEQTSQQCPKLRRSVRIREQKKDHVFLFEE